MEEFPNSLLRAEELLYFNTGVRHLWLNSSRGINRLHSTGFPSTLHISSSKETTTVLHNKVIRMLQILALLHLSSLNRMLGSRLQMPTRCFQTL